MQGNKMKMALGLPVGAVMNCGDNTGSLHADRIAAGYGAAGNVLIVLILLIGCDGGDTFTK